MSSPESRPKVSLEDLLQLKRAERPAEEFWTTFERELRQKQLTALMEKRAWWQELPVLLRRHAYLPVGATAILAFTLVSVKFYLPTQVSQIQELSPSVVSAVPASTESVEPVMQVASNQVSSPLVNRSDVATRIDEAAPIQVAAADVPARSSRIEVLPLLSAGSREEQTPSARSIAANLARLEQSEPELLNAVLGARLSPAPVARVQMASAQTAEFSTVSTGNGRRSRLLAQYSDHQSQVEPAAPEVVRDRLNRRLDSELNDRITRVGVRGDQVSLKF